MVGISLSSLDNASKALSPPDGVAAVETTEGGVAVEAPEVDFGAVSFSSGTEVPGALEAGSSSVAFECAAEGGIYSWVGEVGDEPGGCVDCELPGRVAEGVTGGPAEELAG